MRRILFQALLVAVAALAVGCGSGAVTPPEVPEKPVGPETRVHPQLKDAPRLIAPPPAYGNKVVMASAGQAGAVN